MGTKPSSFPDPTKVMEALVAASTELIYARDPVLGAALDVPPPLLDPVDRPTHVVSSGDSRGLAYRAARKVYRKLKHVGSLQPILQRVRHEILIRRS